MSRFSLAQLYALRAAYGATRHMLVRQGRKFSTEFMGGTRVNASTVESLIGAGLMMRGEGSTSVTLTPQGITIAAAAKLEADQIELVARARAEQSRERSSRIYAMRRAMPAPEQAPATRRLPYADN